MQFYLFETNFVKNNEIHYTNFNKNYNTNKKTQLWKNRK